MRKIILNLAVSLDGFIEGPNGEIDWCHIEDDPAAESTFESHFDRFLARIDTIFYGRISYDLWGNYEPGENASLPEKKLWDGVHSKQKYVFSKSANVTDEKAIYINENIVEHVREIKSQPGKDIWLYGGASLTTSFINLGLVDNYLLAIYPIILGGGKPLFSDIKNRMHLALNKTESSKSGVILLDYDGIFLTN